MNGDWQRWMERIAYLAARGRADEVAAAITSVVGEIDKAIAEAVRAEQIRCGLLVFKASRAMRAAVHAIHTGIPTVTEATREFEEACMPNPTIVKG